MQQNFDIYGGSSALSCNSQALEVKSVTILEVFDDGAYQCNCNGNVTLGDPITPCGGATTDNCQGKPLGTYFSGCTSNNNTIKVRFKADVEIKNVEYDLALYINTQGRNVLSDPGESCVVQGLSQTSDNGTNYTLVGNNDGDVCLDAVNKGFLYDHPFPLLTLNCRDTNNDRLLDFSLGVSFSQSNGE